MSGIDVVLVFMALMALVFTAGDAFAKWWRQ